MLTVGALPVALLSNYLLRTIIESRLRFANASFYSTATLFAFYRPRKSMDKEAIEKQNAVCLLVIHSFCSTHS